MKLLSYKDTHKEYTYYIDSAGQQVRHGEYRHYRCDQRGHTREERCFLYHGVLHGEHMYWKANGNIEDHNFMINGEEQPYAEMNAQEKLLFQIQHPGFRFFEN